MNKLLFLLFTLPAFGASWSGCAGPSSRQSAVYIVPTGAPAAGTLFATLNQNSTDTPSGFLAKTTNLCPSDSSPYTTVSSSRAGFLTPHPVTGELYVDNANAGTVPNTSHVRYLAANATLTDTASVVNGWGCTKDPTRGIVICQERNGDIFVSTDGFTVAVGTNLCAGSPITGISVTVDGTWWALCDSVNSFKSTDAGAHWTSVGSCGGACTQIMIMQNGSIMNCQGQGNAYNAIYNGSTTWTQLGAVNFPGGTNTVGCNRLLAIGTDIWMAAFDSTNNPRIYKTSTGTGAWIDETGTGLPSACGPGSTKCSARDLFYDPRTGYLYVTFIGGGGQAFSMYRAMVGTPSGGTTGANQVQVTITGPVSAQ